MIVDLFAGGGGASLGIELALGRGPDVAINHDPAAIACHRANHPATRHHVEDVWPVDPRTVTGGTPVELLWASPDCTHHSRAKGDVPKSSRIRGLAWVVTRWAHAVRPRVICLENVVEIESWGPLGPDGRADKARAGITWTAWLTRLRKLGYVVEWRHLVAADFGAPTTRKRLYLVARCDGEPIVWPTPTHGPGRPRPWRTAAEIIDWSVPTRSIFGRKKPLKETTLKRIAMGIQRYVLGNARPFIIPVAHQGDSRAHSIDEPIRTVTGSNRGEFAIVEPFVVRHGHYSTITGAGMVDGAGPGVFRGQSLGAPLSTVCATNDKHIVAIITKHYGNPDRKVGGGAVVGHEINRPLGSVTARDHSPTTVELEAGADHSEEVTAFLVKYYGGERGHTRAQSLAEPLHTVTTGPRFGLVVVNGEPHRIVDIRMRMLTPRELFRAQGFPDSYAIEVEHNGKALAKNRQTRLAGNSVCPPMAQRIVKANVTRKAVAA